MDQNRADFLPRRLQKSIGETRREKLQIHSFHTKESPNGQTCREHQKEAKETLIKNRWPTADGGCGSKPETGVFAPAVEVTRRSHSLYDGLDIVSRCLCGYLCSGSAAIADD